MVAFIKKWRKKAISMYGKARGLTEAQRKKVTAAAHGGASVTKGGGKRGGSMAGKETKQRRSFTIPITIAIPIVTSPFLPGNAMATDWQSPYDDAKQGEWGHAVANYGTGWTGVNYRAIQEGQGFKLAVPTYLLTTFLGVIEHKLAAILGVNRYLARAKVPIFRV